METRTIIIDVVTVAVILIFASIGKRRGFVKMITGITTTILAFLSAGFVAGRASPLLTGLLSEKITEKIAASLGGAFAPLEGKLHLFFTGGVDKTIDSVSAKSGEAIAEATFTFLYPLLFFILFVIFILVFRLVFSGISKIMKLPVLRGSNSLAGYIVGLINGLILVWILSYFLISTEYLFPASVLEKTVVLKTLYHFNPLTKF